MKTKLVTVGITALATILGAAMAQGPGGGKGAPKAPGMSLSTPDFEDGGIIPEKYTQQAGPTAPNPKLVIGNVPPGTQTFVLLFHDPDGTPSKGAGDVTHWLAFNIPGDKREIAGGLPTDAKLPDGTVQAKNQRGNPGYMGPGNGAINPYHHYTFELWALDTKLDLGPDAARDDVMKAMAGHAIGKAVLEGRFKRTQ